MAKDKIIQSGIDVFKSGTKSHADLGSKINKSYADVSAGSGKSKQTYGTPTREDFDQLANGSAFGSKGGMDQFNKVMGAANGNLQRAAMDEGRTVLGMAGNHAIRGAAWGAVGGGTMESMQGGSFWDGAKQGAVNGAVGWTGYRMGMKATGASSMNPFAGNNKGLFSSASTMTRAYSKDAEVSGQAVAILNNRQLAGTAQSVMNTRKAASRDKKG